MNRNLVAVAIAAAVAALVPASPLAAGSDAAHRHAEASPATARGVGVVRAVDAAQGKVTLQHEAIAELGWPPMTMAFKVKDPKLLEGLVPGRKVHFAFVQQPGGYVITAIE